jgi:hypothetical protein
VAVRHVAVNSNNAAQVWESAMVSVENRRKKNIYDLGGLGSENAYLMNSSSFLYGFQTPDPVL